MVTVNGGFSLLTGADLNLPEEWGVFLVQLLLAAAPFALLATVGVQGRWPRAIGLGLTASFWGLCLADGLSRRGDDTGVNIGMALLMLVSPAFIAAACLITAKVTREL